MDDPALRLRRDYVPLLLKYIAQPDETGLQAAYELGREAMRLSVGLIEVVRIHNESSLDVLGTVRDAEEARAVARAASDFLLELIAAFEIAQRGFLDVGVRAAASGEEKPG
jgi:hypothetical protein